jgi:hypothetical protein
MREFWEKNASRIFHFDISFVVRFRIASQGFFGVPARTDLAWRSQRTRYKSLLRFHPSGFFLLHLDIRIVLIAFWLGYFIFAYVFWLIYGAGNETFGSSLPSSAVSREPEEV